MNQEPCNCFKDWLERNPYYKQCPDDMLITLCNIWNAGWNEGFSRCEMIADKIHLRNPNVNAE